MTKFQANNALGKHALDYHDGKEITLDMWVTSTHNDPLTRQIQEGVAIVMGARHKRDSELSHLQMNSKAEYLEDAIPQIRQSEETLISCRATNVFLKRLEMNCLNCVNGLITPLNSHFAATVLINSIIKATIPLWDEYVFRFYCSAHLIIHSLQASTVTIHVRSELMRTLWVERSMYSVFTLCSVHLSFQFIVLLYV